MAELKTHKSRIGKGLINMLMFQMYGDEKLIYREYVQNARDAINDAVNHGILGAITDGRISITIDSAKRFIEIRDNGIGIPVERVESVLLDIADSNKDGESSAGQFGIGRLVGGYFCKKLSFRTTYKGEEFASEIVFDIDKIKAILNDENDKRDATDVIDSASSRNYKGDLKQFVIERIANKCIDEFYKIDENINWNLYKDLFVEYIRTRRRDFLVQIPISSTNMEILLTNKINQFKDYYWKKNWEADPEWDRVFVTTLFTFHWRITIDTINFAKKLVKDTKNLMVGGVLATIQAKEVYEATGIKPFKGILNIPGQLDKRNQLIIDNLPLDYSILDEIEYKYPMNNAYYGYTTRGCIRKCPFCAVPKLEPVYNSYIPLRERIEETRKQYGDQKDLLLMDNNILASSEFDTIINDIVACGFGKDAIFIQPDLLALSIAHLRSTPVINERANIRKAQSLIMEFYQKLKGEESFEIYKIIFEKYKINKLLTTTKEHLLAAYDEIKDIYKKHFKPAPRHRYVDFNQGVDARLFTEENVKQLSRIAIRPLRIAFDNIKTEAQYTRAIEMSSKVGLKDFSNYLLYNFDDHPDDLYHRLRINVELCDRLNVSIYSFPMKYHPIRRTEDMDEDYSHNRDYIGKYWNRKYIRAIQAVLNSTKGKIGKGTSFFMKAFGENIEEYHKLLEMPETMIIYRYFFEWLGLENGGKKTAIEILGNDSICNASAHSWWKAFCTCKENVSSKEWEMALNIIHKNDFSKSYHTGNSYVDTLLGYYVSYRQAIIEPNTDLYKLKQVYDQNPLKELRRTQKIK